MGSALLVVWLLVPQHTFVVFGLFLQTLEMVPLMMCCLSPADSQGLSNAAMVLRRALGACQRPKVADQPFNMPIVRRIFTSCTPLLLPLPAAGPLLSITVQTCARSDAMHNLKPQPSHRICTRTTTHDGCSGTASITHDVSAHTCGGTLNRCPQHLQPCRTQRGQQQVASPTGCELARTPARVA